MEGVVDSNILLIMIQTWTWHVERIRGGNFNIRRPSGLVHAAGATHKSLMVTPEPGGEESKAANA